MTSRALLEEALKLPPEERADVAAELLASLPDPSTQNPESVARMWGAEIERRARRVLSGTATGVPWEEALGRSRRRLANQ